MKKKSDITAYELVKNYLLNDIGVLKKNLADLLATNSARYEIDASKVSAIDVAGLQLLTVFASEAGKNNAVVDWKNPSDVFRESVFLMGLDKCISL